MRSHSSGSRLCTQSMQQVCSVVWSRLSLMIRAVLMVWHRLFMAAKVYCATASALACPIVNGRPYPWAQHRDR